MTLFAHIALIGWIPLTVVLFALMTPRRAVIVSTLLAWLFLPVAGYELPGFPDYTKATATSYGVMLGVLLFDTSRLMGFRLRWFDLPMVVWCLVPLASSISNGLGLYDGLSGVLSAVVSWGIPYLMGRLYFSDAEGIGDLATAIFIGGLIYVPLCLWEIRMSPQLHRLLYGFHQHSFAQTIRFGGYRPMVFMQHGLAVGFWMTAASLAGFWLWHSKAVRTVTGIPSGLLVTVLIATAVMCKSMNSLLLLALGLGALLTARWLKSPVFLAALVVIPIGYVGLRGSGTWSATSLVQVAQRIDEERAASFQGRLDNEDILARKAWERPALGWSGWGRNRVYDEWGNDVSVTDGLWIITFGQFGLVGLAALYCVLLLPPLRIIIRTRMLPLSSTEAAPVAVMTLMLTLFAIDSLLNAMPNPIFIVAGGGLMATGAGTLRRPASAPHRHGTQSYAGSSMMPHPAHPGCAARDGNIGAGGQGKPQTVTIEAIREG